MVLSELERQTRRKVSLQKAKQKYRNTDKYKATSKKYYEERKQSHKNYHANYRQKKKQRVEMLERFYLLFRNDHPEFETNNV